MMPNFFVIGTAKSGTDALYSYLRQHPQVYMSPVKEPMFFVAEGQSNIPYHGPGDSEALARWGEWVPTLAQYHSLFADVSTEKAIGEASTWYLYHERAPGRIRHYVPQAKLIAILRNPIERAYSAYTMLLRDGRETVSEFSTALTLESQRIDANWEPMWHYRQMGFYSTHLQRYYDTFDKSQMHVVLYDDFNSRPADVMANMFRFLEVDDAFNPDMSERPNASMVPKNVTYHTLVAGQNPLKTVVKTMLPVQLRQRIKARIMAPNLVRPTPLSPEIRLQLTEVFRRDILQLQELLGRDLSHWLAVDRR